MQIRGPFGLPVLGEEYLQYDHAVLVAYNDGIIPLVSVLRHIAGRLQTMADNHTVETTASIKDLLEVFRLERVIKDKANLPVIPRTIPYLVRLHHKHWVHRTIFFLTILDIAFLFLQLSW